LNHHAKYLGQRSIRSKVDVRTDTHNRPIDLPGPLSWSVVNSLQTRISSVGLYDGRNDMRTLRSQSASLLVVLSLEVHFVYLLVELSGEERNLCQSLRWSNAAWSTLCDNLQSSVACIIYYDILFPSSQMTDDVISRLCFTTTNARVEQRR